MSRTTALVLTTIILLSMFTYRMRVSHGQHFEVETRWENAWTLTSFHENGKVKSTLFSYPKVIWNGSQWVDYVLNSSDMSGGIGSVYVKCGPTYATIYCPNGTYQREVVIGRESWMAEWYDESSNEWILDESSHDEVSYSVNSSGVCFIRKSILNSSATLKVSYVLRKRSSLKYLIDLNATTARKYRIVWKLAGINCTTARSALETMNVTSTIIIGDLTQERLTTSWVHFLDDLSNIKASISWFDTFWLNETAGQYETCFQRLELTPDSLPGRIQAKVLFGNFTLAKGETAYLDPTLKTLNLEGAATVDGSITKTGDEYPPNTANHCLD